MAVSNEQTEKILQELLGLQDINDKNELTHAINSKLDSLNKLDRRTLELKVGMRIRELENLEAGVKPPTKKVKLTTIIISLTLSFFAFWLPIKYDLSLLFKIPIFIFASVWALSSLQGAYKLLTGKW